MSATANSRIFRTLILCPKPGKEDQVQNHFADVIERARKDFPGVLQLHLYAVNNVISDPASENAHQIIGQAIYENEEAVNNFHIAPYFVEFRSALQEQGLLTKPPELLNCTLFAGFQRGIVEVER